MTSLTWTQTPDYIHGTNSIQPIKKSPYAFFDLDDTLIKPKSNSRFSKDKFDWIMFSPTIPEKLHELHSLGFNIAIITNQKGLKTEEEINNWKEKLNNVSTLINLPINIYAILTDSLYRKPRTKILTVIPYKKKKSFYCGDAGGLPKRKVNGFQFKKDFADTDLKFALNAKLRFIHRDEFITQSIGFILENPSIPPKVENYQNQNIIFTIPPKSKSQESQESQEIIIMVGIQGSGKSTIAESYQGIHSNDNIRIISKDIHKTKFNGELTKAIKSFHNVIIDNTNPSKTTRMEYINKIKKLNPTAIIRCFYVRTSKEHSMHNNAFRALTTARDKVPAVAFNTYLKNFEEPSLDEGFDEICMIDPMTNPEPHPEPLYNQYLF